MKTMNWTQRICIGAGLAVTSMFAVPTVAGADPTCYTACTPSVVSPATVTPPSPTGTNGVNSTAGTNGVNSTAVTTNGSSSLPFTGADIGELAAVGVGAVVIGGVLTRRRRRSA